jgi:glycolate oxidase FAD binding subunit
MSGAAAAESVAPGTVDEVSQVLREADGLVVAARGGGTKDRWGTPRRPDLTVDLGRLDRIIDHAAGDMVVQVQAGVRLDTLATALAQEGQHLAVDVPSYDDGTVLDAGTVGGALAVGLAGPRRLRYGAVRDLVLGVRMVRADGTVATSGGRVVKNVAGYDLGKLLCGSYGTLGLIVEATLRLHPLPATSAWVEVDAPGPAQAYAAVRALAGSQHAPSAVEIDRAGADAPVAVAALFEGTAGGVAARAEAAAALVGGTVRDSAPEWFGRWPGGPDGALVELTFPPAALADVIEVIDEAGSEVAGTGASPVVRGSAAVASLRVALASDVEAVAAFLAPLRDGLTPYGGYAVLRHAPEAVRAAVDVWGPMPAGALELMHRVKDQFDPQHRLPQMGWRHE